MKRIGKLLTLLLLLTVASPVLAQLNISDFYQTGAVWQEAHHNIIGHGQEVSNYNLTLGGDTVFNGKNYKVLQLKRISLQTIAAGGQFSLNTTQIDFGMLGGVRVSNQKVYFYRTGDLPLAEPQAATVNALPKYQEILLYDFNLTVGTSVTWKPGEKRVNFMNAVAASRNRNLKTFIFWPIVPGMDYWIEGVGSEMGFFGSYRSRNVNSYFSHTAYLSPFLSYPAILAAPEEKTEVNQAKLYPNPLEGNTLNFAFSDHTELRSLTLTDAVGREVYQEHFSNNPQQLQLDINPGMYTARMVCADGKVLTKRLLKPE